LLRVLRRCCCCCPARRPCGVGCLLPPVACESSMGRSESWMLEGRLDSGCSLLRPVCRREGGAKKGDTQRMGGRVRGAVDQLADTQTATFESCSVLACAASVLHSPALRRLLLGGEKGVPPSAAAAAAAGRQAGRQAGDAMRGEFRAESDSLGVVAGGELRVCGAALSPQPLPHLLCAAWACPVGCCQPWLLLCVSEESTEADHALLCAA
jgi:hypothetical protein